MLRFGIGWSLAMGGGFVSGASYCGGIGFGYLLSSGMLCVVVVEGVALFCDGYESPSPSDSSSFSTATLSFIFYFSRPPLLL